MRWIYSPVIAAVGIMLLVASFLPWIGANETNKVAAALGPFMGFYVVFVALALLAVVGAVIYLLTR